MYMYFNLKEESYLYTTRKYLFHFNLTLFLFESSHTKIHTNCIIYNLYYFDDTLTENHQKYKREIIRQKIKRKCVSCQCPNFTNSVLLMIF